MSAYTPNNHLRISGGSGRYGGNRSEPVPPLPDAHDALPVTDVSKPNRPWYDPVPLDPTATRVKT